MLSFRNGTKRHEFLNFGVSGTGVQKSCDKPYQNETKYQEALNSSADGVVIMIGGNDAKPQNWVSDESFKKNYVDFIKSF